MVVALLALAAATPAAAKVVEYTFSAEDWIVNYLRPTVDLGGKAKRQNPHDMPADVRKAAQLVNGMYPGPLIEANENDTIVVHVVNNLLGEGLTIHWHGIHQIGTPYADGSVGVAQAPIQPAQNYTYRFQAFPPGTHWWHSHMDALQADKGIKGPIVVHPAVEPFAHMYEEEKIVTIADEWREPEICLKLEGALPGNPVCAEIEHASFNGQYGDGSAEYPFPTIEVESGKCYRLRFIGMMTNAQNFITSIAGHTTTLIALDGADIEPMNVSSFNLHNGERADVVVCADQAPGNYLINATYDLACPLLKGHFIPPGMAEVPACSFYAYLKYTSPVLDPRSHATAHDLRGTGGGRDAKPLTRYPAFDLNYLWGYQMVKPLLKRAQPEVADETFVVSMGVLGPMDIKPYTDPYSHARWYMDDYSTRRSFHRPVTPLLHTKGECGTANSPVITPKETSKVIEVVINNLSPTAHVLHLHGMYFEVINYADFKWCYFNETACFFEPAVISGCPYHDIVYGDPNHKTADFGTYWGCKYNAATYNSTRMLQTPIRKDMISIARRGWAVIRIRVTNPGFWLLHCHMEQHIPAGMMTVFNMLSSQQPKIPRDTPTEGPCPVNWATA